jgi:hypothetical protein
MSWREMIAQNQHRYIFLAVFLICLIAPLVHRTWLAIRKWLARR